jgi:hypothetical protein
MALAIAFALLLVIHGALHLLGFAKAFGFAELSQLRQHISPMLGLLWLLVACLFVAAAVALFAWPRAWWAIGAAAVVVSLAVIVPSWSDAKFGLIPNALVTAGVAFGFLCYGPSSLRAEYDKDVQGTLAGPVSTSSVTDADLAHLPPIVQRFVRSSGAVGQPRVHDFRVRMHGRIRSGSQARWMPFSAEQYNVLDPPARFFYLNASMFLMPVQGYHRYIDADATMRVKAAALFPVVNASGPEMTGAETVTMLNDMCIMAPASLIDRAIHWEAVDARVVTASFTNARHTVRADLIFNDAGELTNFVSHDRYQTSDDGATVRRMPWSTPVSAYRKFGAFWLPVIAEGRWREPSGEYAYIELTIDDVAYNVPPR